MATLAASTRFINKGVTSLRILTSLASSVLAPTRAEITAGTEVAGEVSAAAGWTLEAASAAAPALGSRFDATVPGTLSVSDSTLTFNASKDGVDIRDTLSVDDLVYVVWMDGGDVEGYKGETFKCYVKSVGAVRSVGDNVFQIQVGFAVTAQPRTFTVPAA